MKIKEVHIDRWRNLVDVHVDVPPDASLISLVGSNGTGKTNMLELLSFAAARFGLSQGDHPVRRPTPPADSRFRVVLSVANSVTLHPEIMAQWGIGPEVVDQWDRTLTLWYLPTAVVEPRPAELSRVPMGSVGPVVVAGGVPENLAQSTGHLVTQSIERAQELNHLFLDADRTYDEFAPQEQEILAASREDPAEPSHARSRAVLSSVNMYQDWLRSMLGLEHRASAEFFQAHRIAAEGDHAGPSYEDPWEEFRNAIADVMPHLAFVRPHQDSRTLVFRVGGSEVPYHELSGGEREVAFLIGQLLRFRLRQGLLLLDEPELHLNAELLERWLSWAADAVTEGQVWIATHSLEAVEVAGPENALVLERSPDGLVRDVARLSDRPIMSTLAGSLGAPAFSLDRQRFILVEGERPGLERRRFAQLCPGPDNLFLEAGSCGQVVTKLAVVTELARETDRIRIGGVVDRDHRDARQRQALQAQAPVHVLGVHEIENFFLSPAILTVLAERNGDPPEHSVTLLRAACDRFAGLWIAQRGAIRHDVDLGSALRTRAGSLAWSEIDADRNAAASELAALAALGDVSICSKVESWLAIAIDQYATVRDSKDLWKQCSGKQVSNAIASGVGFAGRLDLERQVLKLLETGAVQPPDELVQLRQYVSGLVPFLPTA